MDLVCETCGNKLLRQVRFCSICGTANNNHQIVEPNIIPHPLTNRLTTRVDGEVALDAMGLRYAGFWIRAAAHIIDGAILFLPSFLLNIALIGIWGERGSLGYSFILGVLLNWAYFSLLESSKYQATLGKLILGLRVCDLKEQRISFGRATGRFFSKYLSAVLVGIGFFMVAFTDRRQGMHDMMAGTLVIQKQ